MKVAVHGPSEMQRFLDWFEKDSGELPGVARAAIAHLWFETIHPYSSSRSSISTVRASASAFSTFAEPILLLASI